MPRVPAQDGFPNRLAGLTSGIPRIFLM